MWTCILPYACVLFEGGMGKKENSPVHKSTKRNMGFLIECSIVNMGVLPE